MLTENQKAEIVDLVNEYTSLHNYPALPVHWDLTGVTAGSFTYRGGTPLYFKFNQVIAAKQFQDFLDRTVPHEVAHYIDFMNNGSKQRMFAGGRRNMHGKHFKAVMQSLGAQDVSTYHSYDTGARRKQRRWEYKCSCYTWKISTIIHNRVQKGEHRQCSQDCKETITAKNWTGKEIK